MLCGNKAPTPHGRRIQLARRIIGALIITGMLILSDIEDFRRIATWLSRECSPHESY